MKKILYASILMILVWTAAACTPTPPPQSQTWIDKPLQNMTLPVEPYTIGFHAASLNGITQFEVRVDGVVQDTVTPLTTGSGGNGTTLFYSEYDWLPPGPGSYQIQVRAMNGYSVYGPPAQVDVTVVAQAYIIQPEPTEEEPTATPTEEPQLVETGFGPPQYSEMELYYRGSCGPKQLTVEIMTSDPDVYSVVAFFRLRDQGSQATTDWTSVAMSPLGDGYFRFTLSIEGDVPGFANFLKSFLQFQFVATDQGGNELGRTDVFSDVSVQSCSAGISG